MSIAFYKVHNSQDYTPTKLESLDREELLEKLNLLQEDELVVYDLDKPEDEKKPITYNIDHVEDDIDNSLPAWIQRVKEVAKENNI